MQVLVALATARPAVVSRDQLIDSCWGGRIVGSASINRCILALRNLAKQIDPEPYRIETVPRVGYALMEEGCLSQGATGSGSNDFFSALFRSTGISRPSRKWAAASILITLALIAALLVPTIRPQRDTKPLAIAVLPFRNLSGGDAYFAEGLGDEILTQLSRDQQFRVAGRTSSSVIRHATDLRGLGRRLGVAYVVQGSVQTNGERLHVNAFVVSTADGFQLWSEAYDGSKKDTFAIQRQIGEAVASALRRKLSPLASNPSLVPGGDAYPLYVTARGLLKTRNPANARAASALLRRAIQMDRSYAPAWASLGAATGMSLDSEPDDTTLARRARALHYVRHALVLAPELAEAHGTLGMLLNFESPEAEAHIKRAVQLEPNSAENIFWLGHIHGKAGEFEKQLSAYRRASDIDPSVVNANMVGAPLAFIMGDVDGAREWIDRVQKITPVEGGFLRGEMGFQAGDFSEAAKVWRTISLRNADSAFQETARRRVEELTWLLGLSNREPSSSLLRVVLREAPSSASWRARNRNHLASEHYHDHNWVAAKMMVKAGRHRELLSFYYGDTGLLGLGPKQRPNGSELVATAPIVALVLSRNGRDAEAQRLLAAADRRVTRSFRQGRVPFWFYAEAAQIWALQGKTHAALLALETATSRGWVHAGRTDLLDIADEPAFASLLRQPRFQQIRERIRARMTKERLELQASMSTSGYGQPVSLTS